MAFRSIKFNYIPPPTITVPIPVSSVQTSLNQTGSISTNSPLASAIINNLNNLVDTSNYLQSVILAGNINTGIPVDANTNPEIAAALQQLYGQEVPIVTASMYANLLACQYALQSIDASLGTNSSAQADPYAISNITQVNNFIQNALVDSSDSKALAVAILNLLTGDTVALQNLSIALTTSYADSPVDVGSSVNSVLNDLTNTYASIYSSLFSVLTTTSIIDQDVNNILNTYVYQTVADINRITAVFSLLKSMKYKNLANSLFDEMGALVLTRLMSDLAPSYFSLDNIIQRAVSPLKGMTGILGQTVNQVSQAINSVNQATSILKQNIKSNNTNSIGLPKCNPCSTSLLANIPGYKSPKPVKFGAISTGLQFLSQHISLGQSYLNKEFTKSENAMLAVTKRKTGGYSTLLEIMCAVKSLESLIVIGQSVASVGSLSALATSPPANIINPSPPVINIPPAPLNVSTLLNIG